MTEKYPRIYDLCKRAGHSAKAALEIIIDAKRGNKKAIRWIRILREVRRG